MKVCGIIAEYNPFHNGHMHHLQNAKEKSGADHTIIVMSGNFMQRGTPALMDKFARTRAALCCGADLILEFPSYCACGSAEFFSMGAVSLLDKLGAVTHLCFGSECGDTKLLRDLAQIFTEEPELFQECIRSKLKSGLSYPIARASALLEVYPAFRSSLSVLSSPNNILGIEYIKALLKFDSSIAPLTIPRSGSGYHDMELTDTLSSATAIRHAIESGVTINSLAEQLPSQAYTVYQDYFTENQPIYPDDFSGLLHYKLISEQYEGYTAYMDVSEDLSDRIRKNLYRFTTFTNFCDLLKTKELTYSRISRCLLHILLNIKKEDVNQYVQEMNYVPYARILGMRKDAAPLLREIGRHTQVPLISKLADAGKIIEGPALEMLKKDIAVNDIYSSVLAAKNHTTMKNEYSTPIVIV